MVAGGAAQRGKRSPSFDGHSHRAQHTPLPLTHSFAFEPAPTPPPQSVGKHLDVHGGPARPRLVHLLALQAQHLGQGGAADVDVQQAYLRGQRKQAWVAVGWCTRGVQGGAAGINGQTAHLQDRNTALQKEGNTELTHGWAGKCRVMWAAGCWRQQGWGADMQAAAKDEAHPHASRLLSQQPTGSAPSPPPALPQHPPPAPVPRAQRRAARRRCSCPRRPCRTAPAQHA